MRPCFCACHKNPEYRGDIKKCVPCNDTLVVEDGTCDEITPLFGWYCTEGPELHQMHYAVNPYNDRVVVHWYAGEMFPLIGMLDE